MARLLARREPQVASLGTRALLPGGFPFAPECVPALPFAFIYMGLGEDGRAFDWLERAVAEHNPDLAESTFYPRFDPLRSDPRYAALLLALGLR